MLGIKSNTFRIYLEFRRTPLGKIASRYLRSEIGSSFFGCSFCSFHFLIHHSQGKVLYKEHICYFDLYTEKMHTSSHKSCLAKAGKGQLGCNWCKSLGLYKFSSCYYMAGKCLIYQDITLKDTQQRSYFGPNIVKM
jgi:hypothetical protein